MTPAVSAVRLRLAGEDDRRGIVALARGADYLDLHTDYTYWLLLRHISNLVIVAEAPAGQLVGFLSTVPSRTAPRTLFLWQIAVDPSYQGCGLGRALHEQLMAEMRGRDWDRFEVSISADNGFGFKNFSSWARAYDMHVAEVGTMNYVDGDGAAATEVIYQAQMPPHRSTP